MRDGSFLTMIAGIVVIIFISLFLIIDTWYTVSQIAGCTNKDIEHKMHYLEINEVCK